MTDEFDKNYRELFGRSPPNRIGRSRGNRHHRIGASIRPQQRRPRTPPGRRPSPPPGRRAPTPQGRRPRAPTHGRRAPTPRRSRRRIARQRSPTRRRTPPPRRPTRRRSRSRRRSRAPPSDETPPPSPRNKSDSSLSRELRADLVGKHPFVGFARDDFAQTARIFWIDGYRAVDQVRDMGQKERGLFLQETKRDNRGGRSKLSDLRLTLKIFSWSKPNGRGRADKIPFNEVCVAGRMEKWAMNLSRSGACVEPDQDMVNFFSAQLEVGRTARPPKSP